MWPLLALAAAASCSDGTCDADAVGLLQLKQWAQGVPHCRPHCPDHCDAENCADECGDISSETCTTCAEKTGCLDCLTCFLGEEAQLEDCVDPKTGKKCYNEDGAELVEIASRVGAAPDKSTFCGGWAAAGECERNPAYMNANCATSCAKDDGGGGGGGADLGDVEKKVDDIKKDVAKIKTDVADIKAAQARTPSPTPSPPRRRSPRRRTPNPPRRRASNPRRRAPVSSGKCCYETCQRGQCASGLFC